MNTEVPSENSFIVLKTTLGDIKLELYNTTMPITAGNFQKLVEEKFYDGIIFHRIIDGFMVQGGDPDGTGTGGPGYTIEDEFPPEVAEQNTNVRGTISMANAGPDTGGSQFFLNLVDNTNLDGLHPVFGKIVDGLKVLDKLGKVETDATDRPLEEVSIVKATIVE
ncbi:MAG: peptidylprolyl isomerase [Candidatus Dojkabacteria bacterium]